MSGPAVHRRVRFATRRGVSLVEVLVVVLVLSVLVAIALPMLGRSMSRARDTGSLANLRTHAVTLATYAGDWRGAHPAFSDPSQPMTTTTGAGVSLTHGYFESIVFWTIALADEYYGGQIAHASFIHPENAQPENPDYWLSAVFFAKRPYWNELSRTGPQQWGHERFDAVRFPADKITVIERHPVRGVAVNTIAKQNVEHGYAFQDGHAETLTDVDLNRPMPKGEGTGPGTWLPIGFYGVHTVDGVFGRDRG